jgi:hypothetical protein
VSDAAEKSGDEENSRMLKIVPAAADQPNNPEAAGNL